MKKAMKKTALEQLYKKKSEEKTPEAESGVDAADAEDVTEPTAEDNLAADTNNAGTKEPDFEAKLSELQTKLDESKTRVTELEAKVAELEASAAASEGLVADMQEVLAGQLVLRRTALDLAEVDVKEMSAETVLSEFKAADALFMKSLPSGEVVLEADSSEKEVKVFNTITDRAAADALGFE